jgi:hypothetical protein
MTRIQFDTPLGDADEPLLAITPHEISIRIDQEIVVFHGGRGDKFKKLPIAGLDPATKTKMDVFLLALVDDIKGEYQTGAVTARAAGV